MEILEMRYGFFQISKLEDENSNLEEFLILNHTSHVARIEYLLVDYEEQRMNLIDTQLTLFDRTEKLDYCKVALDSSETEYLQCMLPSLSMNGSIYGKGSFLQPVKGNLGTHQFDPFCTSTIFISSAFSVLRPLYFNLYFVRFTSTRVLRTL